MILVALYKTLEGEEFIIPSIESIYNQVDKIVLVNSDVNWLGQPIHNEIFPIVEEWKEQNDVNNKIINLTGSFDSQEKQYDYGLKYIQRNLQATHLLFIDSDEVWDEYALKELKNFVVKNNSYNRYTCHLYTYFRSPFYRIVPPEPLHTSTIIKNIPSLNGYNIGARGNRIQPSIKTPFKFHHFTYVRYSLDKIKRKFMTSHQGDKLESVDFDKWVQEKWNKAPFCINFHPTKRYEANWRRIDLISIWDLPQVFRKYHHYIIDIWKNNTLDTNFNRYKVTENYFNLPKGELSRKDEEILFNYSFGKVLDVGTFLGRSACIFSETAEIVYTIDIFENIHIIDDIKSRKHYEKLFKENPHYFADIRRNLKNYKNIVTLMKTDNIYDMFEKGFFDVIFLDADHSYKAVKKDFYDTIDLLKKGGIMIFHDSTLNENAPHHEVYKFLNEIPSYMKEINKKGSCTVWRKTI